MLHVGTLQQELSPTKNLVAKYSSTPTNNFPLIKQRQRQLFSDFVNFYLNMGVVMTASIIVQKFCQNA